MSEGKCTATLAPAYRPGAVISCSQDAGHYDASVEPTFADDGSTADPGGWHISAGPETTVWCDRADNATPHQDEQEQATAVDQSRPDAALREKLIYFLEYAPHLKAKTPEERRAAAERMVDEYAHELVDRARRGVNVFEEFVGGFQYVRDVREILDVVDPTTPDPDGWKF